jgi:hypothetical protein
MNCGTDGTHQKLMSQLRDVKIAISLIKYTNPCVGVFGECVSDLFILMRNPDEDRPEHIILPCVPPAKYPIRWDDKYGHVTFNPCVITSGLLSTMKPLSDNYIIYGLAWYTDKPDIFKKLVTPCMYNRPKFKSLFVDLESPFNAIDIKNTYNLTVEINGNNLVTLNKSVMTMYKKFINPDYFLFGNILINEKNIVDNISIESIKRFQKPYQKPVGPFILVPNKSQ